MDIMKNSRSIDFAFGTPSKLPRSSLDYARDDMARDDMARDDKKTGGQLFLCKREEELETASLSVQSTDIPFMECYGIADDRQSETGPAVISRTPLGNAVKPLENFRKMLLRHALASIVI